MVSKAAGNGERVEVDAARHHRAVQPAGDLVEVAADAPDGQHQRGINAGDGLATTGLSAGPSASRSRVAAGRPAASALARNWAFSAR